MDVTSHTCTCTCPLCIAVKYVTSLAGTLGSHAHVLAGTLGSQVVRQEHCFNTADYRLTAGLYDQAGELGGYALEQQQWAVAQRASPTSIEMLDGIEMRDGTEMQDGSAACSELSAEGVQAASRIFVLRHSRPHTSLLPRPPLLISSSALLPKGRRSSP